MNEFSDRAYQLMELLETANQEQEARSETLAAALKSCVVAIEGNELAARGDDWFAALNAAKALLSDSDTRENSSD